MARTPKAKKVTPPNNPEPEIQETAAVQDAEVADTATSEPVVKDRTSTIRAAVNTVYDIQKLRIATGNRICQSFRMQAGVQSSQSIEDMDKEVKKMISILMEEYRRVADAYVQIFDSKGRIQKAISYLGEDLANIKTESDYKLIQIYTNMLEDEKEAIKIVTKVVQDHPLWNAFFKDCVGCGPLMAAVCLSRLDPKEARHVSSFWKFAGLDVVYEEYKNSNAEVEAIDPDADPTEAAETGGTVVKNPGILLNKHVRISWDDERPDFDFDVIDAEDDDEGIHVVMPWGKFTFPMKEDDKIVKPNSTNGLTEPTLMAGAKIIDFSIVYLKEPVYSEPGRWVGRAKRHTVEVEYTDRNGVVRTKKSITYNPFLKTKLMGVLADSFLKCPGCKYDLIYRGYRHRIDMMPAHYTKTSKHRHMMAKRYMIKMFLQDLWVVWRGLEGLPVSDPYPVAKLGMAPHGFNY